MQARRSRRNSLPSADAPLELPDGTALPPSGSEQRVEVPNHSEAQRIVASTRRKLADMPAMPKQMNSFAAVLCYTASGLSDGEISAATGFGVDQITRMRTQAAYMQLERMVIDAVKEQAADAVKEILVTGERKAAEKLVGLVDDVDPRIALSAAKDVLDRGGHKAAEKVDVNVMTRNLFRIEVVDKRDDKAPVIDMEAE